jgi:hypothetical protein
MQGEARLRGLERIIYSKTISPRLCKAKPACAGYGGIISQRPSFRSPRGARDSGNVQLRPLGSTFVRTAIISNLVEHDARSTGVRSPSEPVAMERGRDALTGRSRARCPRSRTIPPSRRGRGQDACAPVMDHIVACGRDARAPRRCSDARLLIFIKNRRSPRSHAVQRRAPFQRARNIPERPWFAPAGMHPDHQGLISGASTTPTTLMSLPKLDCLTSCATVY